MIDNLSIVVHAFTSRILLIKGYHIHQPLRSGRIWHKSIF